MSTDFSFIETAEGLDAVARAVEAAPWTALDTESNSMFVYRERVCLLQVNAGGELFLLDGLALGSGSEALGPLAELFADPERRLFMHGAEYDVACMKREYGLALGGIFDTQQAATYLGIPRTGYGALVELVCDVKLSKSHARYDWGTRPIEDAALRYALDDVVYLPKVAQELVSRVRAEELEEEVDLACSTVEGMAAHAPVSDVARIHRIKGVRDLDAKGLSRLVALYEFREKVASKANRPPGRLLNNEVLIRLARRPPRSPPELKKVRLNSGFVRRHGEALLECLDKAQREPPEVPPKPKKKQLSAGQRKREEKLKKWRRQEAEKRGVPLPVVLPSRALEALVHGGAEDLGSVPELGDKRIERYGARLRELCSA